MESSLSDIKLIYNLSEPQKMIYFSDLMNKNTSLNTVVTKSNLGEHNDIILLTKILQEIIVENPGLRIKTTTNNGVLVQQISEKTDYQIELKDFRNDSVKNEEQWLNYETHRIFKLEDSDLYKFILYYSNDGNLYLLISIHHILCDAWSHQSLASQVFNKYHSYTASGVTISNPEYSYLEYVNTEEDYLNSPRSAKSSNYWASKFKDIKQLPVSFKKISGNPRANAKQFHQEFPIEVQDKIISICTKNSISYSSFFLSCLLICLKKMNNTDKHLLGTLSYNRLGKKEKSAVGMFVNTLPLIFNLERVGNFRSLINYIDIEMAGLLKNQRYPLRLISNNSELKELNIAGNINVIYSYQNIILPYDYTYLFSGYSAHPILFRPTRRGEDGDFFLDIDYQIDCFSENEICNISSLFQEVIQNIDEDLDKPINLGLIKDNQNEQSTQANYNHNITLHQVFEDKAHYYGDKTAITFGNESMSYYELNRRANYLAGLLLIHGAGYETPVVLVLDRSLEMMVSILAVLKCGSCYLPLSPEQPISRTNKIIELSGSLFVLHNSDLKDKLEKINYIDTRQIKIPQIDFPDLCLDIKPNDLAYIIYTSGSTGEPKGVMIEHQSVINRLFWMQELYPLTESDVVMQKTPYTFDVSVWELFGWYLNGSVLHFLSPGAEKEPATIEADIFEKKITIIHFVPSMLNLFLEYIEGYGDIEKIKTIRRVNCSGEALLLEHVNRFKDVIRKKIPSELYNLYGPTEATVEVSFFDCLNNRHNFVPIGKPITNVELYVLDKEGNVLPNGEVGELHIGGVCLARGYFNKPDLTNEKFKVNKSLNKRLYSTGDLATYLDDGNIKYLGRIDNQVKIRGNRVELGEIESVLLTYKGISEAAVIAPVDEIGNAYLGAYIVADNNILHKDLRHYIQNELPSYMIPSYFVQLESFPLSSSGKLDRKSLPEPVVNIKTNEHYHAPINDREEEICEIWEDVLKLEKIGRHDNFFQLGGDSLSLIQVMFPLQKKYDITLQDLFEFQTIESLSLHIHKRNENKIEFNNDQYSNIVNQRKCAEKIKKYFNEVHESDIEKNNFSNILITGATGFLGSYLVREYLENSDVLLFLLIRGDSLKEAGDRLKKKFEFYFGNNFYSKFKSRINIVTGDVISDHLGINEEEYAVLSAEIDAVIHCAANVRHFGDREELQKVNVGGTKNVLEFCKHGTLKNIFFVSTVSIGLNNVVEGSSHHFIESDISKTENRGNVYIDSKIIAEELVRELLPELGGQILRIGNVVNDSKNGKFQENYTENAFYSLMSEYKTRGEVPNIDVPFIDLSYVNETAQAIRLLSFVKQSGTFHIFNPNIITLKDMFCNQDINIMDFNEYISKLNFGDSILTHGYYLHDVKLLGFIPYNNRTQSLLSSLGFKWSQINQIQIGLMWEYWNKVNDYASITL